jgi:hypothetical protein
VFLLALLLPMLPASAIASGTEVIELERIWEVGADEDEEFLFGVLSSLAVDGSGNVYTLDRQLTEVSMFSPDGEYLGPVGREGEGPGEFTRIGQVFVSAPGEIGVVQRMPGRIVTVRTDGTPGGEIPLPDSLTGSPVYFFGAARAGSDLVLNLRQVERRPSGVKLSTALVRIDASGREMARLSEFSETRDMTSFTIDERSSAPILWDVDPDGNVCVNDSFTRYEVRVHAPTGEVLRILRRDYEPRQRSAEEVRRNTPRMAIQRRGGQRRDATGIPSPTDRDVQAIFCRPDRSVWVLSSRGAFDPPEGILAVFDEFDASGAFSGKVALRGGGDFSEDGLHLVGNRLFLTRGLRAAERAARGEGDDDEGAEPMSVVCFELSARASRLAGD